MNGGSHLAIGAGSTAAVLWGLRAAGLPIEPAAIGAGALVAGLGALMPDIDHPKSTASRILPRKLVAEALSLTVLVVALVVFVSSFAGKGAGVSMAAGLAPLLRGATTMLLLGGAFYAISFAVRAFTGHRGATHSFVFAGGATVLAFIGCAVFSVPEWYGVLFGWGWLTHLGADATTRVGLPSLYWPFDSAEAASALILARPPAARVAPVARQPMPPAVAPTKVAPPVEAPMCPKCGVRMVIRTARRGGHVGERFYGCPNFPRCRYTAAFEIAPREVGRLACEERTDRELGARGV